MKEELYQRVAALSAHQRTALAQRLHQLETRKVEAVQHQRLVAYVVSSSNASALDPLAIRTALKAKLPPYMVPAVVMPLPSLPRTANGKIDTRALPEPPFNAPSSAQSTAPITPVEESLAQIWSDVLGVTPIGIHDNFFELGGDSILSIQIVSQAREAGFRLAPNQLFEQPTIAELAAVVNSTAEVTISQATVTGPVPLTPIQHWFFTQEMVAPQHWHQAALMDLPSSVGKDQVEQAIATLWNHHDALRMRFIPSSENTLTGWQQVNAAIGEPPSLTQIDLSALSAVRQRQAVANHGSSLHSSLNLVAGNLMRAAHFTRGAGQPSWLLISLHHLVVDAVSWQILQSDLRTLLAPSTRPSAQLPAKTTAFQHWGETLAAQATVRQSELPFWLAQLENPLRLPRDTSDLLISTEGTACTETVILSATDTSALLTKVPAVYNTQINDALLTALTQTLLRWSEQTTASVRIEVEAHGREQIVPEIDVSRTVGWFTTTYPVRLQLSEPNDPGTSLKAIKEQLRQVPNRGIGYGILRYLSDKTTRQRLAQYLPSEVLFNYLGQQQTGPSALNEQAAGNDIRLVIDADLGTLRDPENRRNYLLEINAWVAEGQLHINWIYDIRRYRAGTISGIANAYLTALKAIITHCAGAEQSGFTPSDFPDVIFTQTQLDGFIAQLKPDLKPKNIEAIYPLAPLQQAFLWHSLQDSSHAGLLHMRGTLHGDLDLALLKQSWNFVVTCHPALRTSAHWEALQQPVQVVARQISLPWQQFDWRKIADPEQAMAEFLAIDRNSGFDFTQAPIMRLAVIRLGDRKYEMIWSCHHLMLDGWSGTMVVDQVLNTYEALQKGETPAPNPAHGYQAYIRWLKRQNESAAERFWRETLKGFSSPTPLPVVSAAREESPLPCSLSPAATAAMQQFLRANRLTLNTLIQGIWALLLHRHSGQLNVLFGTTVSGRQADLSRVESIVGLLINVLPVRIQVAPHKPALSWLQTLQRQQSAASQYAYASPVQIQSWSECSGRLFNSLLVVENYPTRSVTADSSLHIENLRSGIISTYGLTIIAKPGDTLAIEARTQDADSEPLQALLNDFQALLHKIVETPTLEIQQILSLLPPKISPPISAHSSAPHHPIPNSSFTAPQSALEFKLTQIWESTLGISSLSTEASFFDSGGDSLLAVQLFNQMQQQLDCSLPLATLFRAPSVRQFAALLNQAQSASPWSSLVPIQTKGTRLPFFFHGGSADALTWAKFSRLLGDDQPFYALQRPDLDGSTIAYTSVEDLATACIDEMRTVQPNGPYLVGGHCFGGAVAFEIVRQLQAKGAAIASLIEIDAYCPNALPDTPSGQLYEQLQLSYFSLRKSYYYHGGRKLSQLPQKIWQRIQRSKPAQPTAQPALPISLLAPDGTPALSPNQASLTTERTQSVHLPYEERYAQAHQSNISAAERYYPKSYPGRIKLFRADVQILDWRYGSDLGWQTATPKDVEITTIPGFFGNLFNQQSGPLLAQQVKAYLDTLQ